MKRLDTLLSIIAFMMLLFFSFGCHVGEGGKDTESTSYDYTPTVTTVTSQYVDADSGSTVEVTDLNSSIYGLKLIIPGGALLSSTTITIGVVNNPPELPTGLNYIGAPIDLGPDGTIFNDPITIEIPYHDEHLSDAGISDDAGLALYCYNTSSDTWVEIPVISIDTVNNKISAEVTNFSYYAITGQNGTPPEDLGTPRQGDLLYKLGSIFGETPATGWRPGHVGIYTGEKPYPDSGLASDKVKDFGMYNVVEARRDGVQYSYYDIPNVTETYENELGSFSGSDVYMGARQPADITLTFQQREDIVAYVEAQVGKPYAWAQTVGVLFGMLRGSFVKGPISFNCVGLAEKAYEEAAVNEGTGLTTWWQEEVGLPPMPAALTPAEHYNATRPAGFLDIGCFSSHFADGYYVQLYASDPTHYADSITVTGPGLDTPFALTFEASRPDEWWSVPNVFLGPDPEEPLPFAYTFDIESNGEFYALNCAVDGLVDEFATNLSPSSGEGVSGDFTFTWTGTSLPGATYQVQLDDYNHQRIWDSEITTQNSIPYTGPALSSGTTYIYYVVTIYEGDQSLAQEEFLFL